MIYIKLIIGLALLVYGGNMLVDGSVKLAKRLGISSLLIGLVLVGFGTSTPELVASLISVFENSEGIAVGNVVGSNIANILLVLGAASVMYPVSIDIKAFRRDGVMLGISTVALIIAALSGVISRFAGVVMVLCLLGYICYSYYVDRKTHLEEKNNEALPNGWLALAQAFVGIALTAYGADLLVKNAIEVSKLWHVSDSVIGLTIVAVGTSLPELTASVVASFKKENGVAFGNVVGSNIYNALFILGTVSVCKPVNIPTGMEKDILIMTIVTILLCSIAIWQKKFTRLVGVLFLLSYVIYTWLLF